MDLLTWTCMVCGEERLDQFISVVTTDISSNFGLVEGTIRHNVRYCNDRIECFQGALNFSDELLERMSDD